MFGMLRQWRNSLLLGTVVAVVGVVYLVGSLFMVSTWWLTQEMAVRQATEHLGELINTVESTASIAAYTGDRQLASEVASGLLRNREVAAILVRHDGRLLAQVSKPGRAPAWDAPAENWLRRPLKSPFDRSMTVGEIVMVPDDEAIESATSRFVRQVNASLALLVLITAGAVLVIVLKLIVRPIKRISDRLHKIDPVMGQRLRAPIGHERNELGRLSEDINELLDKLVKVLDDERELRRQREVDERKYRGIFDNAESGIFVADHAGRIESFNPAFSRLSGFSSEAAASSLDQLHWASPDAVRELVKHCVQENTPGELDIEVTGTAAGFCWVNLSLRPVGGGYVQGVVTDVTQRILSESAARQLAYTDVLTGLGNRAGFERRLAVQLEKQSAQGLALILIDLIGFTQINDGLGMAEGDEVLRTAARRIANGVKSSDWLARLGGDDFAIVLPDLTDAAEATAIGRRVVAALGVPYTVDHSPVYVGANAGITMYPLDGGDVSSLLRNAELALAEAERAGEPSVCVFEPRMFEVIGQRRRLEGDLRLALERNEMRLFFQPIVDLQLGRVSGAEALIRWFHPERGMVPPDSFIPLAEQTGFVRSIGLWVLNEACRQLAEWQQAGLSLYVSINVSAVQIPNDMPPSLLLATVERYGLTPASLALEITEGVLMTDSESGVRWLREVRAAGFNTYMDDFGTGYSSLSYLKRFPLNTVKIDKSFVRDMGSDSADYAMVKAIVAMTSGLDLSTVAEGVETAEQLGLLKGLGCQFGQGYFFSRPVPAADFPAVLDRINGSLTG